MTVAKKLDRRYLGFELSPEYARRASERLEAAQLGQALEGGNEPSITAKSRRRQARTPG